MIYKIALILILILPFIGASVGFIIGKKNEYYRNLFNDIITGIVFLITLLLYKEAKSGGIELFIPDVMGTGLYLKLDMFRYIFVAITSLIWFLTTIYTTQYIIKYKNRNRYYAFFMLTLGSTLGIFMSENILNLFTFFEIMSFTSYFLVIHDEDKYSIDAGRTYISMAIGGGLVLLMGIFLLFDYTQTLNISEMSSRIENIGDIKYLISGLIIIGFGVKASMVPFHIWLPKAYPAAPAPASAILSGILVKTGIFGIILVSVVIMNGDFYISLILLILGLLNMLIGGFLGILQRNIKRILAYSSMSQTGYILLGIGLFGLLKDHKELAIYGVMYHVINHAIFKVLLFLGAGIIYMILHDVSINVIRGFGKNKVIFKGLFLIGILSVMGVPGFNGFASKTILHEALIHLHQNYHNIWVSITEVLFTISSSFTVVYLLKIFVAVFLRQNDKYSGQYKSHIKKRAIFPMMVLGIISIIIGLNPQIGLNLMNGVLGDIGIRGDLVIHFFTYETIKSSVITLIIGLIIYGFVLKLLKKEVDGEKIYINPSTNWLSLEEDIYNPLMSFTFKGSSILFHLIDNVAMILIKGTSYIISILKDVDVDRRVEKKKDFKEIIIFDTNIISEKFNGFNKLKKYKKFNKIRVFKFKKRLVFPKIKLDALSFLISSVRSNLNSLLYSVFIFALMLVITLSILVL